MVWLIWLLFPERAPQAVAILKEAHGLTPRHFNERWEASR